MPPEFIIAAGFYVVFLLSVTLHEAAHAWAAHRLGDDTAYLGGQVSLDPLPHIRREPFGMVVLPIVTVAWIGWPLGFAHAPYDPIWADRYPKRAAWMALAGPGANLALLVLAAVGLRAGLQAGLFQPPSSLSYHTIAETAGSAVGRSLAIFLSLLFTENLLLLLFNLIPLPPMDGSAALALFLPRDLNRQYTEFMAQPMMPVLGLFLAWIVFNRIFGPAYLATIDLLYAGIAQYG
ncbi:MAG: site-2 protease family protein [Planctomycetota bacterium]